MTLFFSSPPLDCVASGGRSHAHVLRHHDLTQPLPAWPPDPVSRVYGLAHDVLPRRRCSPPREHERGFFGPEYVSECVQQMMLSILLRLDARMAAKDVFSRRAVLIISLIPLSGCSDLLLGCNRPVGCLERRVMACDEIKSLSRSRGS